MFAPLRLIDIKVVSSKFCSKVWKAEPINFKKVKLSDILVVFKVCVSYLFFLDLDRKRSMPTDVYSSKISLPTMAGTVIII
jgi:hypothetical protein